MSCASLFLEAALLRGCGAHAKRLNASGQSAAEARRKVNIQLEARPEVVVNVSGDGKTTYIPEPPDNMCIIILVSIFKGNLAYR